ncbi:hypothetical protein AB0L80_30310 [Streptomyces sp. NPDC052069]|uniref:hypothetical protein n=1 Tax=Streptomyces sp. NPDC052069 TaxID=3154650 RepID=UPI0034445D27
MREQRETAASLGGLEVARAWADVPVDHLEVALKALEPQLMRDHEYRMAQQQIDHELELKAIEVGENRAKQAHALYLAGLAAGFIITVGMLAGAVIVGSNDQPWIAAMLSGPSVLALATVFVLRRNDAAQTLAVARSQRVTVDAMAQTPPTTPGAAPEAGIV